MVHLQVLSFVCLFTFVGNSLCFVSVYVCVYVCVCDAVSLPFSSLGVIVVPYSLVTDWGRGNLVPF